MTNNGWIDDGWAVDGRVGSGWKDGWIDGWVNEGWMGEQMDG